MLSSSSAAGAGLPRGVTSAMVQDGSAASRTIHILTQANAALAARLSEQQQAIIDARAERDAARRGLTASVADKANLRRERNRAQAALAGAIQELTKVSGRLGFTRIDRANIRNIALAEVADLSAFKSFKGMDLSRRQVLPMAMVGAGAGAAYALYTNPALLVSQIGFDSVISVSNLLVEKGVTFATVEALQHAVNGAAVLAATVVGGHLGAVALTLAAAAGKVVKAVAIDVPLFVLKQVTKIFLQAMKELFYDVPKAILTAAYNHKGKLAFVGAVALVVYRNVVMEQLNAQLGGNEHYQAFKTYARENDVTREAVDAMIEAGLNKASQFTTELQGKVACALAPLAGTMAPSC